MTMTGRSRLAAVAAAVVVVLLCCALPSLARVYPREVERQMAAAISPKDFPPQYFQQILDHFNPLDHRTFQQRYYTNEQYFDGTGPIFLYINGEGPVAGPPYLDEDEVVLLAKEHNGFIVTLEHRFYGASQPFPTWETPNLIFLNTKQALNDLAHFIVHIRELIHHNTNREHKIFTIGGSYSGALSAWFRLKYPHITHGSIASSGVVNAILDFTSFDEQVAESVGPDCTNLMRTTQNQIQSRILASNSSNSAVKVLFEASTLVDDGDFFYFVADVMATSVQYDFQIQICEALQQGNQVGKLVEYFANFTNSFWVPIFGTAIHYSTAFQQIVVADNQNADRQWWWQTCSELAYWQNAPKVGSIRTRFVNMTYFKTHCQNVFGTPIWPNTRLTNEYYGANRTAGSRIFFANGSQDPWKRASVLYPLEDSEPAETVICENCGHCVDLRGCANGCTNPSALDAVRATIAHYVRRWLAEP